MARKKSNDSTTAQLDTDSLHKEITKEFGDDIIISAENFLERDKQVIPWSPNMDGMIGGGIEEGSWITISGPTKKGKTSHILHFAANAQQPENGDRNVYYHNVEHRLRRRDILGIPHMRLDKFEIVESTEEKILTTQDHLKIIQKEVYSDPGCVVVIDSLSALCDEKEFAEGIGKEFRASGHKAISQFVNHMTSVVPVKRAIVFSVVHLMANVTGYGKAFVEKMNNRLGYQTDYKIVLKSSEFFEEDGQIVGIKPNWICEATPLGFPHKETQTFFRFGIGIDGIGELVDVGMKLPGIVNKAGSWYKLEYLGEPLVQFQGIDGVYEYLRENPEQFTKLGAAIKEMIG